MLHGRPLPQFLTFVQASSTSNYWMSMCLVYCISFAVLAFSNDDAPGLLHVHMWAHLPIADRAPWPIQVGAILQGCVASVKPYGLFVRLDGFRANGLVHSSQVGICWLNRDAAFYAVLKAVWTCFTDRCTMPCQLVKAHQSMMWAREGIRGEGSKWESQTRRRHLQSPALSMLPGQVVGP